MKVLVVGASGATGRLLVQQLLNNGISVRAVVRSNTALSDELITHNKLTLVKASLLNLSEDELTPLVKGVSAIVSCLGHNLSFKGIYGQPRKLVTEAVQRLCKAAKCANEGSRTKLILMNTTGNRNRDISEKRSLAESCLITLIRILLPPHSDNEQAADFLRSNIGQKDTQIEWVVVRPDTLIDETKVSEYELHPSPTRSPLFNAGETSRINVAHFIGALTQDNKLWQRWKGRMPVIYNKLDD